MTHIFVSPLLGVAAPIAADAFSAAYRREIPIAPTSIDWHTAWLSRFQAAYAKAWRVSNKREAAFSIDAGDGESPAHVILCGSEQWIRSVLMLLRSETTYFVAEAILAAIDSDFENLPEGTPAQLYRVALGFRADPIDGNLYQRFGNAHPDLTISAGMILRIGTSDIHWLAVTAPNLAAAGSPRLPQIVFSDENIADLQPVGDTMLIGELRYLRASAYAYLHRGWPAPPDLDEAWLSLCTA